MSVLAICLAAAGTEAAFADPVPRLGIATVDSAGASIYGYYVVLSQSGAVVSTGFSPAEFTLNGGQEYVVSVGDYGDYVFDHWRDTGSQGSDRAVSLTSDAQLTAVYKNINDSADSPPPDPEPPASSTQSVTIRTIDSATNNEISGYYVALSQGGAVIDAGFSPADFTLADGQAYSVSVSDYGSYYFNYWQDSGDESRERAITASGSSVFVAVYSPDPSALPPSDPEPPEEEPSPPPVSGQSSLTVRTRAGSEVSGYYTVLSQGGAAVATGFSPAEFTLENGQGYTIFVSDYGDFAFDHWEDTGSAARERSIVLAEDTEITAIYRNLNGDLPLEDPAPLPEDPEDPPVSGQSTIIVNTASSAGAISGYHVTLSQNGAMLESGFSPAQFTIDNGETYAVSVSDYGDYAFDHWEDSGSESRERSISVTEGAQFTAIYENINGDNSSTPDTDPVEEPKDPEQPPSPPDTDGSITVHAYRMPAVWWGPTFEGAGANMYFVLYNSSSFATGQASGFADENGHAFGGLDSGETYYVLPTDCEACHDSNHNVIFRHWEDGSTERLRPVVAGSASVGAYFEYVPWT